MELTTAPIIFRLRSSTPGGFMISRRRFLEVGGVTAGMAVASHALAAGTSADGEDASLPPSLAQLKSRKSEATPITREERQARQERARQLMTENALDAIVLMEGTSLRYFSGIRWWGGERIFSLVLPAKGAAFYVCPAFEEGRAREQIANGPGEADVRIWQEDEGPYHLIAQGLKDRGIASGKIGLEETIRFVFAEGIGKEASQATMASATPVTAGCRKIKSDHEIALMRLASQVTLAAYEAGYKAVKEGMTQKQLENLVEKAHDRLGFPGGTDVQVGEFSAFPHGSVTPQVVHEGTIVLMDGGCTVEGYQSDITRTFVLGKPTARQREIWNLEKKSQDAGFAAAKIGAPCESVDAAARKVITDAGFGPDYKVPGLPHRTGHGIGLDGHEWTYLVKGNKTPLAPGMCFSDEPMIAIYGEFGVRLEDCFYMTENGPRTFSKQSPAIDQPFG